MVPLTVTQRDPTAPGWTGGRQDKASWGGNYYKVFFRGPDGTAAQGSWPLPVTHSVIPLNDTLNPPTSQASQPICTRLPWGT